MLWQYSMSAAKWCGVVGWVIVVVVTKIALVGWVIVVVGTMIALVAWVIVAIVATIVVVVNVDGCVNSAVNNRRQDSCQESHF